MLQDVLTFINFTYQFQNIERVILLRGRDRWENDAEHTYQLTLLAWYIIEHHHFKLDKNKVIKLSLIHDLVEAYAGDTFLFGDADHLASKVEREKAAAKQLEKDFPTFGSLHRYIKEYEAVRTPESRFVYALDKIIPILNIYLDDGRLWREHKISLAQLDEAKRTKVAVSPELVPLFDELMEVLGKEQLKLFN